MAAPRQIQKKAEAATARRAPPSPRLFLLDDRAVARAGWLGHSTVRAHVHSEGRRGSCDAPWAVALPSAVERRSARPFQFGLSPIPDSGFVSPAVSDRLRLGSATSGFDCAFESRKHAGRCALYACDDAAVWRFTAGR